MSDDLQILAKRRADLVRQLISSGKDLPPMSSGPDRADADYAHALLTEDVAALETALLEGLPDDEHRHSS
ncbi:hypothetical protein AB0393_28500 [Streptomyces cyaneofuscatus]|uniref:hypothetical protein n=1 Tax=Streptomyces cyaneofuscatus TaxID=66883 RepID=UPI00344B9EA5